MQYLVILSGAGGSGKVDLSKPPTLGQAHGDFVILSAQRWGYWLHCGERGCLLHNTPKVYATTAEAMKRGRIHQHAPNFRIWEGTKTKHYSSIFYNDQPTVGDW